jgi:hypothetical protein
MIFSLSGLCYIYYSCSFNLMQGFEAPCFYGGLKNKHIFCYEIGGQFNFTQGEQNKFKL